MRAIDLIVIHCSSTRENYALTEQALEASHRLIGFDGTGYHSMYGVTEESWLPVR